MHEKVMQEKDRNIQTPWLASEKPDRRVSRSGGTRYFLSDAGTTAVISCLNLASVTKVFQAATMLLYAPCSTVLALMAAVTAAFSLTSSA